MNIDKILHNNMYSKSNLINLLKTKRDELAVAVEAKRVTLSEADNARLSRYLTGRIEIQIELDTLRVGLSALDSMIKEIEQISRNSCTNKVSIGDVVTVSTNSTKRSYLLLGEGIDLDLGIISSKSPLGKAVLDKNVGETITYQTPNGESTVSILSTQPLK